ncbi:MAG: hypothetical protein IKH35_03225 [Prevotella sp.]|nr:hypothetical protein [Prevotella sp.]
MKKLLTLFALMACFLGVKADEVTDVEIDYTTVTSDAWNGGWRSDAAAERVSVVPGEGIYFHSEEATDPYYDVQFQLPGVPSLDSDASYTITIKIKGNVEQNIRGYFSGSDKPGDIPVTKDEQTLTFTGCQDNPSAQYFASSGAVLIQCGDYVGDWTISYIKISHEERADQRPVTWQEWLTNDGKAIIPNVATESIWMGNAETPWPDWALETTDGINANWRTDRAPEICAWSLTMGRNFDDQAGDISTDSPRARPYPTDIEPEEGNESNHVFAVHVDQIDIIDTDASVDWSNQFWIECTQGWKDGQSVRIKFKYKAQHACKAGTQWHQKNPSIYNNWNAAGDVEFTTEWKEFDKTLTVHTENDPYAWGLAFNLCSDATNGREPNVFYFDDLSWETMVLDEGFFVASSNTASGIEYDLDNAIEFQPSDEDGVLVATVGTAGKKDSWVNEIMISTVRGHDASFKSATLKPSGSYIGEDNWGDYTEGSNAKIKLPAAGVWTIYLAIEDRQINIIQEEGDEYTVKEPIEINPNPSVLVVNALERQPTSSEEEGGEGQPWDNQFWVVANRIVDAGEETVVEFDYVASKEAKSTTQSHAAPGDYRAGAIGDVNFTTEEQHFSMDFVIPTHEKADIQSIAFNLAEIKDACEYTFKNFIWRLKDSTESLIDQTGAKNFCWKVVGGEITYFETDGISTIVANKKPSAATYNLAGQRVSKTYKGIVVKDGKKHILK